MEFSTKLRNLRVERGLTQMELAKALETSQSAITGWESARREADFSTIRKIARYFNVPLSALFPTDDMSYADRIVEISESIHTNPKMSELFDLVRYYDDSKLDTIITMAKALKV